MIKISLYKNVYDNVGKVSDLEQLLTGKKYKKDVLSYRKIKDPERRLEAKKMMPMFTPSGLFANRSIKGLIKHSGLICLDVDYKDNPEIEMPKLIKSFKYVDEVFYAGLSVSGKGCFILIPILVPQQHQQHFLSLSKEFARLGVVIDKMCADLSRARFVSYDTDAYFNPNAKIYEKMQEPEKQQTFYANSQSNVEMLAKKVIDAKINITESYADWFALACSLRNVSNGRQIFHQLSSMDGRYDAKETEKQFDAVAFGSGYNETKFFEICKRYGIMFNK